MTTGNVTAEDAETLELLRLREEVERLRALRASVFCSKCGRSLEFLGDGLIGRSGQCEACEVREEVERLKRERSDLMRDRGELIATRLAASPVGVTEGELPGFVAGVLGYLAAERDAAREEVERLRELTKRVFVGPCVHGRDPYERCDVEDVPPGVVPCGELQWWEAAARCGEQRLAEAKADLDDLKERLVTLTAERDAAVAMAKAEREACAALIDAEAQRLEAEGDRRDRELFIRARVRERGQWLRTFAAAIRARKS